ncbi:portal protein [uncultured Mediterranean phage]|nr:portal protein [uncultured Mediterranean phage]
MAKLSKTKLLALISQEISSSLGFYSSDLSKQREEALKYYLGEPLGNEVEGRSSVVSQDLLEVIESMLPSLMRMFTQSDKMVNFDPQGPEDVPYAEQITDYCNFIFNRDNDGFSILHSMFKTALLQKNGFCKIYWKTSKKQKKESYKHLDETQYQTLLIDEEIEILEVEEILEEDGLYYNVDLRRTKEYGRCQIDAVPPEEILVSPRAKTLSDCNFIAHRVTKTVSELLDMGFNKKDVENLPTSEEQIYNTEAIVRRSYDDPTMDIEISNLDPSMRVVQITECYMNVDVDGDGIAELRKIIVGGSGYNNYIVLENEEINHLPFAMCVAVPMPFRFFGLSMYDLLADVQMMSTAIMRQTLDNMYTLGNARTVVVDGQANLDDLLTSRPGGIVRVKSPNAVVSMPQQNFLNEGLAMMQKIDQLKEKRSGVPNQLMGLNPDTINKSHTTAQSVNQMMNSSTQRIELIARSFADGVKDIFKNILAVICEYQDQERIVKLRGQFIPMNPREWTDHYDCTVQVGLGTGNQDQRLEVLQQVLNVQEKMISQGGMGMVTPQTIYNTIEAYLQNSGYKDATQFFNNPSQQPPQPPKEEKQDPALQLAAQQIEISKQKAQADIQLKAQKQKADEVFKAGKLDLDQQKLATDIINKEKGNQMEKEKLASKIIDSAMISESYR